MTRSLVALLLFVLAAPAAGQTYETGYASWYNRGFHGLETASGEAYDHDGMTAAHPSLAFGTIVEIARVDNGQAITVRINDRMLSGPGHVIDLSGAAARELGMLETGVAKVNVRLMSSTTAVSPTTRPTPAAATATVISAASSETVDAGYTLQLGVFSALASAESLAADFDQSWIRSVDTHSGRMYRVYFRRFDEEQSARNAQASLWTAGHDSFLRRY